MIRPHPEVVEYLRHAEDAGFFEGFSRLHGGPEARDAIGAFLERYGMRCAGEIDVTRARWSERPTTLVPLILSTSLHKFVSTPETSPPAPSPSMERGCKAMKSQGIDSPSPSMERGRGVRSRGWMRTSGDLY